MSPQRARRASRSYTLIRGLSPAPPQDVVAFAAGLLGIDLAAGHQTQLVGDAGRLERVVIPGRDLVELPLDGVRDLREVLDLLREQFRGSLVDGEAERIGQRAGETVEADHAPRGRALVEVHLQGHEQASELARVAEQSDRGKQRVVRTAVRQLDADAAAVFEFEEQVLGVFRLEAGAELFIDGCNPLFEY